jgi:hypothetical protein
VRARVRWIAAALIAAAPALADETDGALAHFEAAREAFERGDFESALREFEAARVAGISGPAVDYNIGVAAYRVGELDTAAAAFGRVSRSPEMAALAHYNLGLVALRRGETGEAVRFFRLAAREAADASLRDLANAQLVRLQPAEPRALVARFASLGLGYDGNVALVSDADLIDPSGVDSAFLQAQFAIVGPLHRALRLEAAALHTNYTQLDRYDELTLGAGARYRWSGARWSHEAGASTAYATLDAEGFEWRGTLTLQTQRELAAGWSALARYRLNEVDGLDEFEGLTGTRQHWTLQAERRTARRVARLEYAFESSDLTDPLLSSDRHVAGAGLRSMAPDGWEFALDVVWRHADYGDDGNGSRDEHQGSVSIETARNFGEHWRLFARYEYLRNESSDAQFDFDRHSASLGLTVLW